MEVVQCSAGAAAGGAVSDSDKTGDVFKWEKNFRLAD